MGRVKIYVAYFVLDLLDVNLILIDSGFNIFFLVFVYL